MIQLFLFILFVTPVFAEIKDNSFVLEEAYNQKPGEFQFIQSYASFSSGKEYKFISEGEMSLGSESHQFSYQLVQEKETGESGGGDTTLNYRFQSMNEPDFLMAHRFGIIFPTGSVGNETSYGVTGFKYIQAMTYILNEYWDNHWNLLFNHYPQAKVNFSDKRRTLNEYGVGSSFIFHWKDNLNFLVELIYEANEKLNLKAKKIMENKLTLNPGVRTAIDLSWKETQIVPGLAIPIRYQDDRADMGVFLYLSIEPKF